MKLLYIGNKLSKHGNSTTVIETLGALLEKENYTVIYASNKKNQFFRLLDMIFTTIISARKVSYVLIDTYSTSGFYYALIVSQLCRILNLKYIPILHGGKLPGRIENSKFLSNMIFKNAYINCAPSYYLMDTFKKNNYYNCVYIPNSIEIKYYNFLERKSLKPTLLWVRSFSKIYNPKMAIEVVAKLKNSYPNASLTMVGPDKENILEQCKDFAKSLKVNVNFIGKLSKKEWTQLSTKFDIFLNTTHFDNTPVSVIEAMALGLTVISTNVGGLSYLISNEVDGYLVNDNAVDEMVDKIIIAIKNPNSITSITINARKKVAEFDWEIVKNKWFEILN